ncbi:protein ALP1-like, partial [Acropora millepora]|uniref:protein ALP1-like n=1 Tax=Acropora millepora TaxID=45264 RepID=UPI001CF5FB67
TSAHDARVLRKSNIYQEAEQGNILQAPRVDIDGNDIGPYLVGDSPYPLTPWLIKPFPEGTNDPDEKTFHKKLSRARVVVERAFGILKGHWRVLQKRLDSSLNFAIKTTIACIVLHNFCIEANDDWDDDNDNGPPNNDGNNNVVVGDADEIKVTLKDFVCGNV